MIFSSDREEGVGIPLKAFLCSLYPIKLITNKVIALFLCIQHQEFTIIFEVVGVFYYVSMLAQNICNRLFLEYLLYEYYKNLT